MQRRPRQALAMTPTPARGAPICPATPGPDSRPAVARIGHGVDWPVARGASRRGGPRRVAWARRRRRDPRSRQGSSRMSGPRTILTASVSPALGLIAFALCWLALCAPAQAAGQRYDLALG